MFASLKRPHSEQLLQGLQLLRQDHELCDIVLRVGDAKIHAHKVVLASISPYFKAMFTGHQGGGGRAAHCSQHPGPEGEETGDTERQGQREDEY